MGNYHSFVKLSLEPQLWQMIDWPINLQGDDGNERIIEGLDNVFISPWLNEKLCTRLQDTLEGLK